MQAPQTKVGQYKGMKVDHGVRRREGGRDGEGRRAQRMAEEARGKAAFELAAGRLPGVIGEGP